VATSVDAKISQISDYIVMVIGEYALLHGISLQDAFCILDGAGAITLLEDMYEIEHTLPLSSTLEGIDSLVDRMAVK
jgi:hypothetical protein